MSTISVNRAESSFSCMDTYIQSFPLKVISCVPVIGLASTALVFVYSYFACEAIKDSLRKDLTKDEDIKKTHEVIEWTKVSRDHCLASVVRQVANIGLVVLGITAGNPLSIALTIGVGFLWIGQYIQHNDMIEEASSFLAQKESSPTFDRI